jgi:hypothetical protein
MPAIMDTVEVRDILGSEGSDLFHAVCMNYLSMSGSEFLTRWNRGLITHADAEKDSCISRVISSLPFAA